MIGALPSSWSALTWQQLTDCWQVKIQYGGNPDVCRAAALLKLCGLTMDKGQAAHENLAGETVYRLRDKDGNIYTASAREVSHLARKCLAWFDFPYGDQGEPEKRDDKGKVIHERREAVNGYVSQMRDAMILPEAEWRHFQLPQVACSNFTWQQYRSIQTMVPQIFGENRKAEDVVETQARFLAHCLTPRSFALLDTSGGSIRIRPHWEWNYNSEYSEGMTPYWRKMLRGKRSALVLFHICFQCYQTAVQYYSVSYPLLFSDSKQETMRDALQGEVGTINTIMKYQGFANPQDVYDANLPIILDVLNTMAKEAKEIEKIKSKTSKK